MVPSYCMSGNKTGHTSHSPPRTSGLQLRRELTGSLRTLTSVPQSKVGGVYHKFSRTWPHLQPGILPAEEPLFNAIHTVCKRRGKDCASPEGRVHQASGSLTNKLSRALTSIDCKMLTIGVAAVWSSSRQISI
eukprot:1160587-Pelagomonas_calceolata.AAC.1